MRRSHFTALVGTTAVASLLIVLCAMHFVQPMLSPADHFVSEYAHGRLGWLVPLAYVVAGFGTLLMVWPLVARFEDAGWVRASAGCLTLAGLGLIGTGLTRIDVAEADGVLTTTRSGQFHEIASLVAVIGLVAGAFLIPAALANRPVVPSGTSTLKRLRWGLLLGLAGVLVARPLGSVGLAQRAFLLVALSWLVLVGVQLSGFESASIGSVLSRMDDSSARNRGERCR